LRFGAIGGLRVRPNGSGAWVHPLTLKESKSDKLRTQSEGGAQTKGAPHNLRPLHHLLVVQ